MYIGTPRRPLPVPVELPSPRLPRAQLRRPPRRHPQLRLEKSAGHKQRDAAGAYPTKSYQDWFTHICNYNYV
jgi:hypothetical protein